MTHVIGLFFFYGFVFLWLTLSNQEMMGQKITIEDYLSKHSKWEEELTHLRSLVTETELEETIKWGQPTYTLKGKNVLAIGAFKGHFGIWFFKGALLADPDGHLINAQKGKTKAMRHLKFSSYDEMDDAVINKFIYQAIENQKAGKEVQIDVNRKADIPSILEEVFLKDDDLKSCFDQLTPGRQREYAEYLATAKQDSTKLRRLEKILPMIRQGIGLNDKYI